MKKEAKANLNKDANLDDIRYAINKAQQKVGKLYQQEFQTQEDDNTAFKSYAQQMNQFLDKELSDESDDEPKEQINVEAEHVQDREQDCLEPAESKDPSPSPREPEPLNLDELRVSVVQLQQFNCDQYLLDLLNDKYSPANLEQALKICREFADVYLEDTKIIKKFLAAKLARTAEEATHLMHDCSSLLML